MFLLIAVLSLSQGNLSLMKFLTFGWKNFGDISEVIFLILNKTMEEKPAPVEEKHLADTERVCRAFFKSFDLKQIFFKEPRSPKIPKTGSRQHGFQCPFNPSQIATYLIFLYDLGTFFCINMTVLSSNTPLVVILGLAYVLNSAVVVFFAILATKSDPTDPTVYEQRYTESLE